MKSVIKKQTQYNLLLMREDDHQAHSFSLRGWWLRFGVVLLLLLVAGGSLGIYVGSVYWVKYKTLSSFLAIQEHEMSTMRLQLERLKNLESLLDARNGTKPLIRHEEVGVNAPVSHAKEPSPAVVAPLLATSPTEKDPTPPAASEKEAEPSAVAATEEAESGDASSVASAEPETEEEQLQMENASSQQTPQNMLNLSAKKSPLHITAFNSQSSGQQQIRIRYDLVANIALTKSQTVSGKIRYLGVFNNGTATPLSSDNPSDAYFSISRMKPIDILAPLPNGVNFRDIKHIDVFITLNKGMELFERFSIVPQKTSSLQPFKNSILSTG